MFNKKIFLEHLQEFLTDSLYICEKNSDKLIFDDLKWPIFFPNGKYKKYEIKKEPDYDFFIKNIIKNEVQELHSNLIIVKFFVTSQIKNYNKKLLGDVHENFDVKPDFANDLPLKFLVEYVNLNRGFNFNKKIYQKTLDSFTKFLENPLEDEYVTPLFNFESDINKKGVFVNDIEIRKVTELEFYKFVNLDENSNISSVYHNLTHVLATKLTTSDLSSGHEIVKNKFQNLLDSFSLFTIGNPQFGTIFRNINNPWFHYDSTNEKNVSKQLTLKFKKNDSNKITSILNSLNLIDFTKKENKFLDIAIRRFRSALARTDSADQFIDLMISLEALYGGGERGEITTKLSSRLATLVAKNEKEREDYWKFTKKMYSLRSGIVHGSKENIMHDESLEKIIKLVRKSIHLYLKLANSYSGGGKITTICDDIDAALVNKEKLKLLKSKLK